MTRNTKEEVLEIVFRAMFPPQAQDDEFTRTELIEYVNRNSGTPRTPHSIDHFIARMKKNGLLSSRRAFVDGKSEIVYKFTPQTVDKKKK